MLRAAPQGTGIIAGGPMRAVFETLGMQDVVAKSLGSSNPYNLVRATFNALKNEDSPRSVAARRGLKVSTLQSRRRDASTPTRRRRRGLRRAERWLRRRRPSRSSRSARRSAATPRQRQTLVGLGLNKLHRSATLPDTPAVRGMIEKVKHLVRVEDAARS